MVSQEDKRGQLRIKNKISLTIFTPTYNRAYILHELFESLQNQNNCDFEWLIVDDGSTDNTKDLVERFKQNAKFPVHYIYQENQGKHVAINTALDNIKTEYFVTVDSDDRLIEDLLEIFYKYKKQINENQQIAALSLQIRIKGRVQKEIREILISTPSEIRYKHQITGEFSRIFKTEIARKYKFPVFENEKFMQESVVYNRMNRKYKFLYAPDSIVEAEYLEDGLSAGLKNLMKDNPKGAALSFLGKLKLKEIPFYQKMSFADAFWDYESLYNFSFFSKFNKIPGTRLKISFLWRRLKRLMK